MPIFRFKLHHMLCLQTERENKQSDATSRIHLDATPRIYLNHVARCQQRIPTIPDIHIPWRPIQHSGLNKQISRRSTFTTCTTVHATINREIYINNFAYITITITSYVRHSDHITRGNPRPQYTTKLRCFYLLLLI